MHNYLITPLTFKTLKLTYKVSKSFVINRFNGMAIKGWLFDESLRKMHFYEQHQEFKNNLVSIPKYLNPPEYFILHFPYNNQQLYNVGHKFKFEFTLIGSGLTLESEWLKWFVELESVPIGYLTDPGRLVLEHIEIGTTISEQSILESIPNEVSKINVNFLSPIELKIKDKAWIASDLPFYLLITHAMQRIRLLNFYYCPGIFNQDYVNSTIELESTCQDISINHTDLELDKSLYRSKDDKELNKHHIPGLVGNISYKGHLQEWLPILYTGAKVNLGHLSAWGKGQLIIDAH